MYSYMKNKFLSKIYAILSLIWLVTAITLCIIWIFIENDILKILAQTAFLLAILNASSFLSSKSFTNGFDVAREELEKTNQGLKWEDLDALMLNHHSFYVDDIAWGSYGWPAPAGDKFDIWVWERRTDGARYITVEIKNYIWFICFQTRQMIFLVPPGDSEIPHDTSLENKEFLGIISEMDRSCCNRLFRKKGTMTLHVNGRWYDEWERFEYNEE